MHQLTIDRPGGAAWRDVPDARIEAPDDVVVHPLAVARCDLDGPLSVGLLPFVGVERHPHGCGLGHEVCGEVVEVGDAVRRFGVGDRVIVPFQISCGVCDRCRSGLTNACASVPFGSAFGLGPFTGHEFGGGLADLLRVPFADRMLLRLPEGLDPHLAAGIPDNVSDGYRCVADALALHPGGSVLVRGGLAPSVGLYAAAWAIALGAASVWYLDDDAERRAIAAGFGAEVVPASVDELTDLVADRRFAATVDAGPDGLDQLVAATVPGGVCTSVWGAPASPALPLDAMYVTGVTYRIGRVQARVAAPEVLDHIAAGRFDPEVVPLTLVPIGDADTHLLDPSPKVVFVR